MEPKYNLPESARILTEDEKLAIAYGNITQLDTMKAFGDGREVPVYEKVTSYLKKFMPIGPGSLRNFWFSTSYSGVKKERWFEKTDSGDMV